MLQPIEWKKINEGIKTDHYLLSDSPIIQKNQVKQLLDAGANYVVTGTLPPFYSFSLTTILPFMATTAPFFKNLKNTIQPWLNRLDSYLRDIQVAGEEQRIDAVIKAISNTFFISQNTARKIYYVLYDIVKNTITQFNRDYIRQIEQLGSNHIVFFDAEQLFNEIITDPKAYGIDSITVPACTFGHFSSLSSCHGGYAYHNDKSYLSSDMVHLTKETQKLLADYIISIFEAPVLISQLVTDLRNQNRSRFQFLETQAKALSLNQNSYAKNLFFGMSMNQEQNAKINYLTNLNVGYYHRVSEDKNIGLMLTLGKNKMKRPHGLQYDYNMQGLSLFAQITALHHKIHFLFDIYGIHYRAKNIKRPITIGINHYVERSATHALNSGIDIKAKYFWEINKNLYIAPIVSLNFDYMKLKKIREQGLRSTAMHFDQFKSFSLLASTGLLFETRDYPVNIFAEVLYQKRFNKSLPKIKSAINVLSNTYFEREIKNLAKDNYSLTTGFYYKPKPQTTYSLSYQKRWNKKSRNHQNVSFGFNYSF